MRAIPSNRGFTLIELMIAVVVVAILASVAYPSYVNQVRQARRSDAKDALLRIQLEQERWRAGNTSYTGTLGSGGLGLAGTSPEGYYTLTLSSATATGYTATATATGSQAADSPCATISLTYTVGTLTKGGTSTDCWR